MAAGSTIVVEIDGEMPGSMTLEPDGKLTYTRPSNPPMQGPGVELVYELKNAYGTSTAHAGIAVKKSWVH